MIEEFKSFIERLEARLEDLNYLSIPEEHGFGDFHLDNLLTQDDLHAIYRYVLTSVAELGEEWFVQQFNNGTGIRVDKDFPDVVSTRDDVFTLYNSQLARTFQIAIDAEGKYALIVHTGKKPYDYSSDANDATGYDDMDVTDQFYESTSAKLDIKKFVGTNKEGIAAWRVDLDKPQELARMIVFDDHTNLRRLTREVGYSKIAYKHPHIAASYLGARYINKHGKDVCTVYAPMRRMGSLYNYMFKKNNVLSLEEAKSIILDILRALKVYHDNGLVHQDLKLENILLYSEIDGKLRAELTDFGNMRPEGYDSEPLATRPYESPEIIKVHREDLVTLREFYAENKYPFLSLGGYIYKTSDVRASLAGNQEILKPNKANDMWALGIIFYELIYHQLPGTQATIKAHRATYNKNWNTTEKSNWQQKLDTKVLEAYTLEQDKIYQGNNTLLKGLLAMNRNQRLTVDAALQMLQNDPQIPPSQNKRRQF